MNNQPRKPDISPSLLVFTQGSPELHIDSIPEFKTVQELEVGNRFIRALSALGVDAVLISQTDDRADIVVQIGNGENVEVQLTECRDVQSRLLAARRNHYEGRIQAAFQQDDNHIPMQHCVTIWADDLACALPMPRAEGEAEVVKYCCGMVIEAVRRGTATHHFAPIGTTGWQKFGLLISVGPSSSDAPQIRWPVSRSYGIDDRTNALRSVIARKLQQQYQKPTGQFWLVIYSSDYSVEDFDLTQPVLIEAIRETKATFSRLWYLQLQAKEPNGGTLSDLDAPASRDDAAHTAKPKQLRTAVWTAPELMRGASNPRQSPDSRKA